MKGGDALWESDVILDILEALLIRIVRGTHPNIKHAKVRKLRTFGGQVLSSEISLRMMHYEPE